MDESLKTTVEYLKTRKQFGVAIAAPDPAARAADMFLAVEQARSMSMFATMASEFDDAKERATAVAAAKVQIGKSLKFVGQQSIQLHGRHRHDPGGQIGHYFKRLTMIETLLATATSCSAASATRAGCCRSRPSFRDASKTRTRNLEIRFDASLAPE